MFHLCTFVVDDFSFLSLGSNKISPSRDFSIFSRRQKGTKKRCKNGGFFLIYHFYDKKKSHKYVIIDIF